MSPTTGLAYCLLTIPLIQAKTVASLFMQSCSFIIPNVSKKSLISCTVQYSHYSLPLHRGNVLFFYYSLSSFSSTKMSMRRKKVSQSAIKTTESKKWGGAEATAVLLWHLINSPPNNQRSQYWISHFWILRFRTTVDIMNLRPGVWSRQIPIQACVSTHARAWSRGSSTCGIMELIIY